MSEEYAVSIGEGRASARLEGILRLATPIAYQAVLQPIQACIEARPGSFRLDMASVSFMNSSGITALSRLVMAARQHDVPLVCVVDDAVPWQRKTLSSLQRLYPKLQLEAR
jgi:hypothetical protein